MIPIQAVGGPPLVFDHQMVIDPTAQVVYVSGGRVIDGDSDPAKYSGLYCYDIREKKWSLFQLVPSYSSRRHFQTDILVVPQIHIRIPIFHPDMVYLKIN